MRLIKKVSRLEIILAIAKMVAEANCCLPEDVQQALTYAIAQERNPLAKRLLEQCLRNALLAREKNMPICQDTGTAVFYVRKGADVVVDGGNINDAINDGVRMGYKEGYLRASMLADPCGGRKNTGDNTPAIIHLEEVDGDKIEIFFSPKGGGAENMSAIKMMTAADIGEPIIKFAVDTIVKAGGNPCPPTIVGIGIGGNFERCATLAKLALMTRKIGSANHDLGHAALEAEILRRINDSCVGPQGLGGDTTALAVFIKAEPCHAASMPVAINPVCWVHRHVHIII